MILATEDVRIMYAEIPRNSLYLADPYTYSEQNDTQEAPPSPTRDRVRVLASVIQMPLCPSSLSRVAEGALAVQ